VTNSHNIPEEDCTLSIVAGEACEGVNACFKFFLGKFDVFRLPESDLVFFRIGCMPPKKNLIDLLPASTFHCVAKGFLLGRAADGVPTRNAVSAAVLNLAYRAQMDKTFRSWTCKVAADTVDGDCGTPMVLETPVGPIIAGLHQFGGRRHEAASVQLTREHVQSALAYFPEVGTVQCGAPNLKDAQGVPIQLEPVHPKSVFRYIKDGVGTMYGSLPGFRAKHRSKVTDTFIAGAMHDRGYEAKVGRPVMQGWEPWRHAALDVVHQEFKVRQDILDECVKSFADDILSRLTKEDLDEVIILDNESTVNGLPGVQFVDKMNRRTSMGFPWRESKSKHLSEPRQHEQWDSFVEFDDDFIARVDDIIGKYKTGTRHMPVFTAHLKDEPTKFKKILGKLTRVFSGAPADWVFVVRKYLLSFVRLVQKNKYTFESGPGTQAHSAEWDEMFHYLTQFGKERIIAGDYSKFDKRMSAQWVLAAFQVIDHILAAAGWSMQDRLVVWCIAYDTAFPLTDFNGDLFEFWGSNPSGHPLTVIINGIVNALYIRYVWRIIGYKLMDFKTFVALMTYGDDNIMGVARSILNFDHTVIQSELAKIGVTYTMADKDSESVPFVSIYDVSFLKRKWRYEPALGSHVAQIEHDSIVKSLVKCIPSKVLCPEAHAVQVMVGAVGEYAYYGQEVFEEKRQMFLDVIAETGLEPYYEEACPDGFLRWDVFVQNYLEASKAIYEDGTCPDCSA
jgi:hypothetical protein